MTLPHIQHLLGENSHKHNILEMAQDLGVFDALSQEATFGTDTTGVQNDIAGLALYNQVNMNNHIIGALPDINRTDDDDINLDSDTPAKTFRATFNAPTVSGVAGGGSLPTASTFDIRKVSARIKISALAVENDVISEIENRLGHDTVGFDDLVNLSEAYLTNSVEKDAIARAVDSGGSEYSADDLVVQLDRVIASADEEANADDPGDVTLTDGDLDVYDIDRSATGADASNESNWADATVDHNSGTDRQLTADLVNDWIDSIVDGSTAEYNNLFMITGRQTARVLSDLRESQFRADALESATTEDVNDTESRLGHNFNARISHWDGIPIVVAPTVPTDNNLERIYALDPTPGQVPGTQQALPKIGIETYRAPDFWRAGVDEPVNPLATGEIKEEAAFAMYHEVVCRDFGAQGKLRDLEE